MSQTKLATLLDPKNRWQTSFLGLSTIPRALVFVFLALVFLRASGTPIALLDTWSQWKYGQWIVEHRRLPVHEPFSPYSDPSIPLIDTAWLSQVLAYLAYIGGGLEGILLAYASLEVVKAALYLEAFRRLTGSLWLALGGGIVLQVMVGPFAQVLSPQSFGELCWAAILLACSVRPLAPAAVVAIPCIVALWANLHIMFPLAWVLLAVLLASRFLEQTRAHRGLSRALADTDCRRLALVLILSVVAACINPYGKKLLSEAVHFDRYPVLPSQMWPTLIPVGMRECQILIASLLVLLITFRLSTRRFTPADVVLIALFALAAWFDKRMVPWWLTLGHWILLPHWQAIANLRWAAVDEQQRGGVDEEVVPETILNEDHSRKLRVLFLGSGILVAGVLVTASPSGRWLLSGQSRSEEQLVRANTPVHSVRSLLTWIEDAARHQRAIPLRIFCSPIDWNDYLIWKLPAEHRVFCYSHIENFSRARLRDVDRLSHEDPASANWRQLVDRYRFNTLMIQADPSLLLFDFLPSQAGALEWELLSSTVAAPTDNVPLLATRRLDPFVLSLVQTQAAQGCAGSLGMVPLASQWAFLSHLPWYWSKKSSR